MSELRQDLITHDWVIINPERGKRPKDTETQASLCPFCPGNEHLTPEPTDCFMEGSRWSVRAVPNKFPALGARLPLVPLDQPLPSGWRRLQGAGYHEVIIETPDHEQSLGTLPEIQVRKVVEMYLRRFRALANAESAVRQVVVFRNHGRRAGTSLKHPHSQIVAIPVVAPETRWRLSEEIEFFDATGNCGVCQVLEKELQAGLRVVKSSDHFVALAPYASRVPYHIQVIPRRHCSTFLEIEPAEIEQLASELSRALGALHRLLKDPDYNLVLVTPPLDQVHRLASHWFIDIVPRRTTPAGFELGSRIVINTQTPEHAAAELRAVRSKIDRRPR
jgi:UDPglucose--hexose-1-phosphate uridylyltransferase